MFALVDDDDFEKVNIGRWTAQKRATGDYHAAKYIGEKYVYMHRLILEPKEGYQTDHIDGNGLNNQKYNLRYVTKRQNQWNRHRAKGRFKGLSKDKRRGTFRANIFVNGKQKYLGEFKTEEEAAKKYNEAALTYFGEFARLNEISI